MEFTREIASFQGAIISADNVHQFSSITSKGGNEEKVKFVVQSIKRFLQVENYINEDGLIESKESYTRKFAMYLVLNADLSVLDDLMDITDLEPLIWSVPTISKYLLCELIWNLHFEKFIYEMIDACWPQLGIEVAEAFVQNFKYLSPTSCLNRLHKLSAACYALLCRLAYFKFQDDTVLSNTLAAAYANLEKSLKYYSNPPNKYQLDALSTDELYKYKGNRLKTLLHLVYDCFSMFTRTLDTNCDDDIYKLTYHVNYLNDMNYKVSESPNKIVVEHLTNSNIILLDIFQQVVMDVSVNIFCAWSEYEENGQSFQQSIGELCYKVQEKLESISTVAEHSVVSMIRLMARKPVEIIDVINTSELDVILQKINKNDAESPSWIRALAYYDNLYQSVELLHIVDSNINIFNSEQCYKLHKILNNGKTDNQTDQQLLVDLKYNLFTKCEVVDKHKILEMQFEGQVLWDNDNVRADEFFDYQLNEMFNKFIAKPDADFSHVLDLFYRYPRKVYNKIFYLASQNADLIDTMLRLMIFLKNYTSYYYAIDTEPVMIKIMKISLINNSRMDACSNNIDQFICKLKQNDIISGSHLLILVIMPGIHAALVASQIGELHSLVRLLIDAYTMDELSSYRAPMLVMVAQIMDVVRPKNVVQFTNYGVCALELTLSFQKSLINAYRDDIPDNDGSWLRRKLRDLNMRPINFYYFKPLWNPDHKNFFASISEVTFNRHTHLNSVAIQLSKVLPTATLEEWGEIWDNIIEVGVKDTDVLRMMHSAVAAMSDIVKNLGTGKSRVGVIYCYANVLHITRYKFFKEPLNNWQVKNAAIYICKDLNATEEADIKDIEPILMPILAYLKTRQNEYNINIPKYFKHSRYLYLVHRFFPPDNLEQETSN